MKMQLSAIYDKKVQAYNKPFVTRTKGEATRIFTDEINRQADDNIFNKHPEDYYLAFLGTYDDETGEITQTKDMKHETIQAITLKQGV